MGGKLKKALCAGILAASLLNPFTAYSQEAKQEIQEKPKTEQTLEKKAKNPILEMIFDYKTGTQPETSINLNKYFSYFNTFPSPGESYDFIATNYPISSQEENQVRNVMEGVRSGGIDSYSQLVDSSKNFSQNQKLVLLASIGGALGYGAYDFTLPTHKVFSQDTFFEALQNYLQIRSQNPLGVCRHIASHLEQVSNDIGMRAAAVTGSSSDGVSNVSGHVYAILKLDNGNAAIIDYADIFTADTKNVERMLDMYQKSKNTIMFEHSFFEDSLFKYRLITQDGKNFLDFINYDATSEKSRNLLIDKDKTSSPSSYLTLSFDKNDSSLSGEANLFGFFVKLGELKGNQYSPMSTMKLVQAGYNNKFMADSFYFIPSVSFLSGNLLSTTFDTDPYGAAADLRAGITNKEGLNLNSRIAGNILNTEKTTVFWDVSAEAGASYLFPLTKELAIEPYLVAKLSVHEGDLGTCNPVVMLEELRLGTAVSLNPSDDLKISLEPYYVRRMWENEFGAKAKCEVGKFGLDAGGYFSDSTYDFCPDKWGINAGLSINLENLKLGIKYGLEGTNYDGEIENNHSLSFNGSIKF